MFLKRLVKSLEKHRIPYVLVGGYAVVMHGVVRGTVDIDLLTSLNLAVFQRIEEAMSELGLQSGIPVTAEQLFQFREEYIKNRNLIAWNFTNPRDPTEMVDILITADEKDVGAQNFHYQGFQAKVIDKKSLIEMKKKSGRPQDIEDVKALEKLE